MATLLPGAQTIPPTAPAGTDSMRVPRFEHSPPMTEVLVHGRSTRAGLAAAFCALGGRGWLEVREEADGPWRLTLTRPPEAAGSDVPETERWLYSALAAWAKDPAQVPATAGWLGAVERQAALEGALDAAAWRDVARWSLLPPLARRRLPPLKAEAARDFARELAAFPMPEGALPQSRPDWDAVFAHAVALGQAEGFLRRAREVNDYYARHFQGVVMTFFTPLWYRPTLKEGLGRFAYLTNGLADLVGGPDWRELKAS